MVRSFWMCRPRSAPGLFGSVLDAWQVPLTDVGPAGGDAGKGGKYLFVPPGYNETLPQGYFPIQFETLNGYGLLRAISTTSSDADVAKALALVKQLRIYPLTRRPTRGRRSTSTWRASCSTGSCGSTKRLKRLARMVNEEPILARDLVMMGQLRSLGIEKGKDFKIDAASVSVFRQAATSTHESFMLGVRGGEPWWPDTHWKLPENKGAKTGFSFQDNDALYVDERGLIFFLAFAAPKQLGAATFYSRARAMPRARHSKVSNLPIARAAERPGQAVLGHHRLRSGHRLPDSRSAPSGSRLLRSTDAAEQRRLGGHYYGPQAPAGHDANWIPTAAGKPWFTFFRFYGPDKPLFEKTWRMTDIEKVS